MSHDYSKDAWAYWNAREEEYDRVLESLPPLRAMVDHVFAKDKQKGESDVNNPPHYTKGKIEAIDYIKDSMTKEQYMGFLLGNVKKYTHRYQYKGEPLKDLTKASWYLQRLIEEVRSDS